MEERRRPDPDRLIPARAGKTPGLQPVALLRWAHPRACGENTGFSFRQRVPAGSSPRVRGKLRRLGEELRGDRLIPARAGKTRSGPHCPRRGPAHPRACGENGTSSPGSSAQAGSSPRVRGKRHRRHRQPVHRGLIPARAGKTMRLSSAADTAAAHPRACGENQCTSAKDVFTVGSSPRVRGKPYVGEQPALSRRLIPARAGKTQRVHHGFPWSRAHPRACGENCSRTSPHGHWAGSSPRVRGKPAFSRGFRCRGRLIPARAGKTRPWPGATRRRRAHPRACGENFAPRSIRHPTPGSSPRVRGKPNLPGRPSFASRLIPARAGKTPRVERRVLLLGAHPRACGENGHKEIMQIPGLGSSPRVRGKPIPGDSG